MQLRPHKLLQVVDLSDMQPNPPVLDPPHQRTSFDHLSRRTQIVCRPPTTVDGIVIHQTGCWFGVNARQLREADGNATIAKHRRALGVAAHMTAFDTGYAVLAHKLNWYVYHANSLCGRSIGLEIEGVYPGLMHTKGRVLTPALVRAAQDGLEYLVQEGRKLGMPLRYIWAHRQSSPIKENDPGEEIWKEIVLRFAVPELGLEVQPNYVSGGRVIPIEWLPLRSG